MADTAAVQSTPATQQASTPASDADLTAAWAAAATEADALEESGGGFATDEAGTVVEKPAKPAKEAKPKAEAATAEKKTEEEPDEEPGEGATPRDYTIALRKLKDRFSRKEQSLARAFGEREQKIQAAVQHFSPLADAIDHLDSGDLDSFAETVGKFLKDDSIKDWNSLQAAGIRSSQNPLQREVRNLKRDQVEARRQAQAQAQRAHQEAQQRQVQERYQTVVANNEAKLSKSEDPALVELTEFEPGIMRFIIEEQGKHYQEHDGDELDPAVAAEKALASLYARKVQWDEFLETHRDSPLVKKITGSQASPKKPAPVTGAPRASARQQKSGNRPPPSVSHTRAAEASATEAMSGDELIAHTAKMMRASNEESIAR